MKTIPLLFSLFVLATPGFSREWTNAAGKKIQAEFGEVKGTGGAEIVVLKMAGGKTYEVPLKQLAAADQTFAMEQAKTAKAPAPALPDDGEIVDSVRKAEATAMAVAVANAVEQFYGDYNRLPKPSSGTFGSDNKSTTKGSEGMVKMLIGKEVKGDPLQNPRNTDYLVGLKPAKASSQTKPLTAEASDKWTNGLVFVDNNYEIVDSWGNFFIIKLDSDYDKELENPHPDEVAAGRTKLPKRVIVWSPGKDGKIETWADNVKSWD